MKPMIKINFSDFFSGFNKEDNDFTNILREKYEVVISDQPDFLFFSTFGFDFLKYHCIRIFYTGECVAPDFNLCDYAIGFDNIAFGDRYLRVPLYQLFQYKQYYDILREEQHEQIPPEEFCSFVCSNDQGMKERFQMFQLLCDYKKVDSGGRYANNVGGPVADKFEFDRKHRFSIAFENSSHPGYTTEKIVQAFAAGTIPIYYGNPKIAEEFNEDAFINCHRFKSIQEAAEYVIRVDQDETLFQRIKKSKPLVQIADSQDELSRFLFNIVDQPYKSAFRRPSNTRIKESELMHKVYAFYLKIWYSKYKKIKAVFRRIKNNAV